MAMVNLWAPAHRGSESPSSGPGGKHLGCRVGLTQLVVLLLRSVLISLDLVGFFPLVSCSDGELCQIWRRVHSRHSIPEGVTPPEFLLGPRPRVHTLPNC